MTALESSSRCNPTCIPFVYGVLNPGSTLMGIPFAGNAPLPIVRFPKGSYENRPGPAPTAALAASANSWDVNPVRDCTFAALTTAFAGIGEWPVATTPFRWSIQESGFWVPFADRAE